MKDALGSLQVTGIMRQNIQLGLERGTNLDVLQGQAGKILTSQRGRECTRGHDRRELEYLLATIRPRRSTCEK